MNAPGLRSFAEANGLEHADDGKVRAATHALAAAGAGGEREVVSGELRPGLVGQLFTVPGGERGGDFTAVLTEVPETRAYAVTIGCQRRDGPVGSEPVKYPKERWDEVRLESALFGREFRLLVLEGQDRGWTYELFSPALISWLTDRAPDDLGFELNEGWLCVLRPGASDDPAALGSLCDAAAELAGRIRDEALDEEDDPDLLRFAANTERMDKALAKVNWKQPPASVADAVAAYRRVASRRPLVLLGALLGGAAGAAILGGIGFLLGPLALIGGVFVGAAIGYTLMREIGTERTRFEGSLSYPWVGINAFNREHARSRGLERRRIAQFHHDNRDLPVRGEADSVQVGTIPGTDLSGAYVMISDSPELRAHGAQTMSATDGRPLSADALVAEIPGGADSGAVTSLELPDGYEAAAFGGGKVVVWRPIPGNMTRTLAGCDEFRATAGAAIAEVAASSARTV